MCKIIEDWLKEEREEGRRKGREEGRKEGLEEGRKEGRQEVARSLLCDGMSPEKTAKHARLSLDEVKKLQAALIA